MDCPLPIDWLDFAEGLLDGQWDIVDMYKQHLGECPVCRFTLELLTYQESWDADVTQWETEMLEDNDV